LAIGQRETNITLSANNTIRFDNLNYLNQLGSDDYLTIAIYTNEDSANLLYEYAFGRNGLHVYYRIPTGFTELSNGVLPGTQLYDTQPMRGRGPLVRPLGGMRLKYRYQQPMRRNTADNSIEAIPVESILWSFNAAGWLCLDGGVSYATCEYYGNGKEYKQNDPASLTYKDKSLKEDWSIWWEPAAGDIDKKEALWVSDLDIIGKFNADLDKTENSIQEFRVRTRILDSESDEVLKGDDVEMLEAVLWQFGLSPQKSGVAKNSKGVDYTQFNAGDQGTRIGENRGDGNGQSKNCQGKVIEDRSIFHVGWVSCPTFSVSTEAMVRRFKLRNTFTGDTIKLAHLSENKLGIVDDNFLKWVKRDWLQYMGSVEENLKHPVFKKDTENLEAWIAEAAKIWESGSGAYVPASLTISIYGQVMVQAGLAPDSKTQVGLLKAWLEQESPYHWGDNNKHYIKTPYRMNEGGADENGSLSFSQAIYHHRYGPNPCAAEADNKLNLYHPGDNIKTMVVHSASSGGSDGASLSCEGGMHRAFVGAQSIREKYNNVTDGKLGDSDKMTDFIGYIDNATGAIVQKSVTEKEDDYEALAKAIGIYNGAQRWMRNMSWPRMIKSIPYKEGSKGNFGMKNGKDRVCHSCSYSIKVRNHELTFKGKLRTYVWKGGDKTDLNHDGVIGKIADDPRTHENDPVSETVIFVDLNGDGDVLDSFLDDPRTDEDDPVDEAIVPWCFAYGEQEWIDKKNFTLIKEAAVGSRTKKPIGRIDCQTGNLI
jgi:hypothetical protein